MEQRLSSQEPLPRVQGIPGIGSAWPASRDAPGFLLQQYRNHGPVFEFRVFGKRFIVLAGKRANLFANKEGAHYFSSGECWKGLNEAYGTQETLISRDGPTHRQMRQLQKDGYSRSKVAAKLPELLALTRSELAQHIGRPIAVHTLMQRLLSLQLGYLCMGVRRVDCLEEIGYFLRTTLACTVTGQRPRLLLSTPRYKKAKSRSLAFAQELLAGLDPGENHLLADLLNTHKRDPKLLPQSELASCVLAPFVAGLDTAASTLAFSIYHLSRNPELLKTVRAQSHAYFEGTPTLRGLAQAPATYGTILETLRLNPIAPALSRNASQDFEFLGFKIPRGSNVILATTVTHYDRRYFPEPERFDIERYSAPRGEHRQPGAYVPFGVGPHTCLGAGMAQALMLLNLAVLTSDHGLVFEGAQDRLEIIHVPTMRPSGSFKVTLRHPQHPATRSISQLSHHKSA